jgi:uncharacterized protein (TIGR02246 family)
MYTKVLALTLVSCGVVLAGFGFAKLGQAEDVAPAAATAATAQPTADSRQADRDAIKAALAKLVKAFESGDAAAATALMTTGAEIIPDDAPPIRGREAVRKAYEEYFAKHPKRKLTLATESVRFTSRDTAIEEGRMSVSENGDAPESQRYSMLLVREDGKWLVALIKEWPGEDDDLEDLSWLIGSWQASRTDVEVKTTYEWFGNNKAFIRGTITAREKDITLSGMQLIGKDPRTGELRIWSFGSDGGIAEGTCTRDGNSWVFESEGVGGDGEAVSLKNILVRVNNDTITWQPVNLTRGDEHVGDLPPVKVTRVKGSK